MLMRACYLPCVSVLFFACRVSQFRVRVGAGVSGVLVALRVLLQAYWACWHVVRVVRPGRAFILRPGSVKFTRACLLS